MKSFSKQVYLTFLIFSGFLICLCLASCKRYTLSDFNKAINDSLTKAMSNCCPPADSTGLRTPPGVVCPESPGNTDAIAFIKHQYDNGHLSLAYYPLVTPKMIHLLDSLNTVRGPAASAYYFFVVENDSARYPIPLTLDEIDSGKQSVPDSIAFSKVKMPPCYYPHCVPTKVYVIDTLHKE